MKLFQRILIYLLIILVFSFLLINGFTFRTIMTTLLLGLFVGTLLYTSIKGHKESKKYDKLHIFIVLLTIAIYFSKQMKLTFGEAFGVVIIGIFLLGLRIILETITDASKMKGKMTEEERIEYQSKMEDGRVRIIERSPRTW